MKTSGAKGLHVYVPVEGEPSMADAAAATRAIAERATRLDPSIATTAFMKEDRDGKVFIDATRVGWASVISAYSPRARPGTPVSFPVAWDDLDDVSPTEFTIHTAVGHLGDRDPWAEAMPTPQALSPSLIEEGASIPGGRVQAMHEGKRRARAPSRVRDLRDERVPAGSGASARQRLRHWVLYRLTPVGGGRVGPYIRYIPSAPQQVVVSFAGVPPLV